MVNEIKLDKISTILGVNKAPEPADHQKAKQPQKSVSVTNHLNQLVKLLSADDSISNNNNRIMAIKKQIESGAYQIDTKTLSEKLLTSGILGEVL